MPTHHIGSQFLREPFPDQHGLFFAQQGNHTDRTLAHLRVGGEQLDFAYDKFNLRAIDAILTPCISYKVVQQRRIEALRTPGEPQRAQVVAVEFPL